MITRRRKRAKGSAQYLVGLSLFVALSLIAVERPKGYIMPAEQLIGFMAQNFSKFKTVVIVQSTRRADLGEQRREESFTEKVWMKSPDLFHSEILDRQKGRTVQPETTYRQLLIANSAPRLMQLLSAMGVNLYSVSLTRINGTIAYRIGDREPESPKILIEKERFLPLLLVYGFAGNADRSKITVEFRGYRRLEQGWYPFEIGYAEGTACKEGYMIQRLDANVPLDPDLFVSPRIESRSGQFPEQPGGPGEEERLRKTIESLEKKYQ